MWEQQELLVQVYIMFDLYNARVIKKTGPLRIKHCVSNSLCRGLTIYPSKTLHYNPHTKPYRPLCTTNLTPQPLFLGVFLVLTDLFVASRELRNIILVHNPFVMSSLIPYHNPDVYPIIM